MKEPKPRKKPGPAPKYPPGKRPTLTFRIQEPLHEKLKETASAAGRSLSEEIERRIERAIEWEETWGDVEKLRAEYKKRLEETEAGNLEAALVRHGFPKIAGTAYGTIYCKPGSVAIRDGKAWRVRKAKFPPGEFLIDPADDLEEQPTSSERDLPVIAGDDIEATVYRAVLRALESAGFIRRKKDAAK